VLSRGSTGCATKESISRSKLGRSPKKLTGHQNPAFAVAFAMARTRVPERLPIARASFQPDEHRFWMPQSKRAPTGVARCFFSVRLKPGQSPSFDRLVARPGIL
jgi:hypothetical protein